MLDPREEKWARAQVRRFAELRPAYERYAELLAGLVRAIAAGHDVHVIVDARAKTVASFAEKIWRKRGDRDDPVTQLTDLCGVRVITRTPEEVAAFSALVTKSFVVDEANSLDAAQRLSPSEFGYRSVHYVVQLKPGSFPTADVGFAELPTAGDPLYDLKAEIQVRTLLGHAWAVASHELSYKGGFDIPARWGRELAGVAATLENADKSIQSIRDGLGHYASSFGAYMDPREMGEEIARLEIGLEHDPTEAKLACRIAMLASTLGDWERAAAAVSPIAPASEAALKAAPSRDRPILRELGRARCEGYEPGSEPFDFGQKCLERAADPPDRDIDALLALARSWQKAGDDRKAQTVYAEVLQADPSSPPALCAYLQHEVVSRGDPTIVALVRGQVEQAVKRCRDHADVGVNLPGAMFQKARLELLLDSVERPTGAPSARDARLVTGPQPTERYRALASYARGVHLSATAWPIQAALDPLGAAYDDSPGREWARRLLRLAIATRTAGAAEEGDLVTAAQRDVTGLMSTAGTISGPVVIVVGGSDASVATEMADYQGLMIAAFEGFEGTIISGGTREGVGGLVGDVRDRYGDRVTAVGYVPDDRPADATEDDRYEIRRTEGHGFSPGEPLQGWIDLVGSGIHPSQVKVIGINGGAIAAAEYRVALALGARVATLKRSGRQAELLFSDPDWADAPLSVAIPAQVETLRCYALAQTLPPASGVLPRETRDRLAKQIHEHYLEHQKGRKPSDDPAMQPWEDLSEGMRESNRQQADSYLVALQAIGQGVRVAPAGRSPAPLDLSAEEIARLAPVEHDRWSLERIFAGWTHGPARVVERSEHHLLVPWRELSEEQREQDCNAVRTIPSTLAAAGLENYRT